MAEKRRDIAPIIRFAAIALISLGLGIGCGMFNADKPDDAFEPPPTLEEPRDEPADDAPPPPANEPTREPASLPGTPTPIPTPTFNFDKADDDDPGALYPVWFGTNRTIDNVQDPKTHFASGIAPSLRYGICWVKVPPHSIRRAGSTGSAGISRFFRTITFAPDDRIVLKEITPMTENDFYQNISAELSGLEEPERTVVVFIHGYNTTFEEASIRAAQLGFDLDVPGVMAMYSWPSVGGTLDYVTDKDGSETSIYVAAKFLVEIAERAGAERVHIIAHSMGNRTLLLALDEMIRLVEGRSDMPFNQLILAAPDLLQVQFEQMAEKYRRLVKRTTLYVSREDRVIDGAIRLAGGRDERPRVGDAPPIMVVDGIDTIEASIVRSSFLGHSTFSRAEPVLLDIRRLLQLDPPRDLGADQMNRSLEPAVNEQGKTYWKITR